jgi:hypothetical protein
VAAKHCPELVDPETQPAPDVDLDTLPGGLPGAVAWFEQRRGGGGPLPPRREAWGVEAVWAKALLNDCLKTEHVVPQCGCALWGVGTDSPYVQMAKSALVVNSSLPQTVE